MRQSSLRVAKNSASLFLATLIERGIAFLLPVYIARSLGPELTGAYATAITFVLLAAPLAVWGLDQLIFRMVARDRGQLVQYLLNAAVLLIGTTVLTLLLFGVLILWLDYATELQRLVLLSLFCVVPAYALSMLLETGIKALERMEFIVLVRLPLTVARVLVAIWLLYLGYQLYAVMALLALYYLGTAIWYVRILRRFAPASQAKAQVEPKLVQSLFVAALPLAAIGLLGITFKQVDRILLSKMDDVSAVGIYSTGAMIVMMVYLLAPALMESLFPGLSRLSQTVGPRFSVLTSQLLKMIFIVIAPVALCVYAFAAPAVLMIFSDEFSAAIAVTQILAVGIVPAYLSRLLFRVMLASDNERSTLRIALVNTVVNIGLNILLIPRYGAAGAAIAAVATECTGFGQNLFYVHRHVVHIKLANALANPLLCALLALAVYGALSASHSFLALLGALAVFGVALVLTRTLSKQDLALIAGA